MADALSLEPMRRAAGTVRLPGSKSISNRVLLLSAISTGSTEVAGLLDADDTKIMLAALRTLGVGLSEKKSSCVVHGVGGPFPVKKAELFLGNAGTAFRPLTAALALSNGEYRLSGVPRMHERPIGDLVDALRALGCRIAYLGRAGYPPLRIEGTGGQALAEAPLRVRGDVSSQFLTALLLALPLVAASRTRAVEVDGELISKPYVDITLRLLERFGVDVQRDGYARFTLPAGSRYRAPADLHVEGDASSASYFVALGAIAAGAAPLRIEGVGLDSIQGDVRFVDAARAMGAQVAGGPSWLEVRRGHWPLRAVDLDCNAIPDAAMTLAVMALFADRPSRLTGIGSWRVKETDRIAAMARELRKLGATVAEGDDFIRVAPPAAWRPAALDTYDDHRMAMCLSLAAFNPLAGAAPPVPLRIHDPRCVAKTFPDYFETLFTVVQAAPAEVPVITIDGPTASGKGTLASDVAAALGYHHLDSGALYRATALLALQRGTGADDEVALARLAADLDLRFEAGRARLAGADVTDALRREEVGALASRIAALPAVRRALHDRQLAWRRPPGLVADGRDMGSAIFPDAPLKVFLTASAATRAERRLNQLISKGISAKLTDLRSELEARDARDLSRDASPLAPAADAMPLDNSALSIEASVAQVLGWWSARRPF